MTSSADQGDRNPPPLWPPDGGGASGPELTGDHEHDHEHREDGCCTADSMGGTWTTGRHAAACTSPPRTAPPPTHWGWTRAWPWGWRLAWPAVLFLVGRVLSASAGAATAPALAPGLGPGLGVPLGAAATLPPLPAYSQPPLPPLPPLPALPAHSAYRQTSSQSLASLVADKLDKLDGRLDKLDTRLDKLDEKLRVVDTMWDTRYRLDTLDRRLGDLDSKVERRMGELDSTLERRFDKLTESVASHDHKDSSAKDQLVRKVDNVYERIIYMENNSINKIQVTATSILDRAQAASAELPRVVEQAVGQAVGQARAELRAALAAVHEQVNATRDHVLDHVLNATAVVLAPRQACQPTQEEDESERRACVDASETTTKTLKQHIDVKTDLVSSKVSNLYNDMWRRVNTLESTAKSIVSLSNATRRDVQELGVAVAGMQHGVQHGGRGYSRQPALEPGNLEYALNLHHTALERQLRELRDTLLDELRNVQQVQDTFLSTCDRLNDKDHSMDEKLGRVLEHHTEYLLQHRNVLGEVRRQLKTHSTLAGRASSNATEGIKRLEAAVRGLAEHGRLEARRIEQALERVDNASAAVQNVSDRISACGGSLGLGVGLGVGLGASAGLAEEEAAWSALLQHNESLGAAVTEIHPQPGLATTTAAPTTTVASASASVGGADLDLVDSNGLQRPRPPPKEPAAGSAGQDSLGGHGSGNSNGLHREQRREAAERAEQQFHSTDSSQDSVTDLSSVDEEDYAETDDDETDLLD